MIADCIYHGTYSTPENWGGVCVASHEVPAGCPAYVMAPHDAPMAIEPTVLRGGQPLAVTPTRTVDSTVTEAIATIDVYSCDCAHIGAAEEFDRVVLTFPGLVEGDQIAFGGSENAENAWITITAAAPCPAPMWPTQFSQATACDRCPMDPADPPGGDGNGGCNATPGAGLLVAAAALLARLGRK